MITLAIDSSSKVATAALIKDDTLLGEITLNDKKEHSVILMTIIQDLLKFHKLDINDIDGYVVSKGPDVYKRQVMFFFIIMIFLIHFYIIHIFT